MLNTFGRIAIAAGLVASASFLFWAPLMGVVIVTWVSVEWVRFAGRLVRERFAT